MCLETRRHGVVLAAPLAKALLLAAIGAALVSRAFPVSVGGAVALAASAAVAVRAVWAWEQLRFLVTTRHLVLVDGILRRRTTTLPLGRIGPVAVEQTLLGRLLGYGTLIAGDLEIPHVP